MSLRIPMKKPILSARPSPHIFIFALRIRVAARAFRRPRGWGPLSLRIRMKNYTFLTPDRAQIGVTRVVWVDLEPLVKAEPKHKHT